ncbi:MAG: hypothetical protein ACJ8AT_37995 [Hyalangium sp.]|uniref:hypothetical protein n=1 Tax=Hyalangium sp. TaxID=2028555 RepID=UPI003899C8E9
MKKLIGLFASVALLGSGVAFAQDQAQMQEPQTQSQGATGGSGSMGSGSMGSGSMGSGSQAGQSGQMGQSGQAGQSGQVGQSDQSGMINQVGGNQLTGRVVKNDKKTVWIEHAGAIVPLKIDKNTQFTDPSLKKVQDLKEGDEIRASFEVRKTDNVATSIGKSSGTGGSGTEVMSPDSSINQSPGTLPSHEGIGGDVNSPDVNKGTGGSSTGSDVNKGSDANSNQSKTSGDY